MKMLDCTLRDGGYYTNWDFSREIVDSYLHAFNNLPVQYLEVGYRSTPMKEYLGEYFYCPDYVLRYLRSHSQKKLAIILNEKDVRPSHLEALLDPCKGFIDLVRLAIDPKNISRAIILAEQIKTLGFEIGFNVMYMSRWNEQPQFIEELANLDGIADYFYMVDSYGGVYPSEVVETINLIRTKTSVPLGFHGHNNLELGLINSLTAMEHGVEMIDATVTGMGRGAGNLKTELLLTALNAKGLIDLDFNALSAVVDKFESLQKEYGWGTNLPYMVSGANSLPQKEVMSWVTKRYYSFNSIIRALQNQKQGVADNVQLPIFEPTTLYENAVVIGGGQSAELHATAIREFINGEKDLCVIHASSKNAHAFRGVKKEQIFCLVGNEGHRLEQVFDGTTINGGKCILPPFPRKMGTYIPAEFFDRAYELDKVSFTERFIDAHTSLALQTAISLGVKKVFVTGYDGYAGAQMGQKEQELFIENDFLFRRAQENGLEVVSITPTKYDSLSPASVYELLVTKEAKVETGINNTSAL